MSWKSALVTSALVLSSQTTLANKSLPCPTTGPIHDTTGVIQGDTRQKIENRLRAIDIEKKHQVVVVTVANLEEYGYGSIEEMANKIGNGCKVGYRGENTGVVVLYTQVPPRYRIENAGTERYVTDAHSGRILAHSKSDGVCKKEDVSCRLDDITGEIDALIRSEFPDKQAVQQIQGAIEKHDEIQSSKKLDEFLGNIGVGALVVIVLGYGVWGSVKGVNTINRRNRRKELKGEILELFTRFQTEKQKYPIWFQKQYTRRAETIITELQQYSNEQLDTVLESDRTKRDYDKTIHSISETIDGWHAQFSEIQGKLDQKSFQFSKQREQVLSIHTHLLSEGYIFPNVEIPSIEMGENPADSLNKMEKGLRMLSDIQVSLDGIQRYYSSTNGFDGKIQSSLKALESEYNTISKQYMGIFGSVPIIALMDIQQRVGELATDFRKAYEKKDISGIKDIISQSDTVLNPISHANRTMNEGINWYNSIPREITQREQQLSRIKPDRKYLSDANAYAQKTGKRGFLNYNLNTTLELLQGMLGMIRNLYSQKQDLDKINKEFGKFDREYSGVQEYIGLGSALATIIADEATEALRRKREIERREREAKEEEEARRRRREQDEEDARKKRDDDSRNSLSSSTSSSSWDSGGGGGFSGGGATSD